MTQKVFLVEMTIRCITPVIAGSREEAKDLAVNSRENLTLLSHGELTVAVGDEVTSAVDLPRKAQQLDAFLWTVEAEKELGRPDDATLDNMFELISKKNAK